MAYIFGEPKTIRNGIPGIDLHILTGVFHLGYLDIHMKNALLMLQKSYKNPVQPIQPWTKQPPQAS